MASDEVVAAVEARLGTKWASQDGNALPVIGLNTQGGAPADGSPHIEVTYPVAKETQLTFGAPGANQWKEEGAFRIIVNEQRAIGTERARGWLKELAILFRGQFFSGVQCFAVSPPLMNDGNDLGNYWQMSIAVEYWFFRVG